MDKNKFSYEEMKLIANALLVMLIVVLATSIVYIIHVDNEVSNLQYQIEQLNQTQDNQKCFVVEEVITKYVDLNSNIVLGRDAYIKNITEQNCENILEDGWAIWK